MDNYKIKVKDEAESKEAQELFFELGYSNRQSKRFGFVYTQDGEIGCDSMEHWDYYTDLCKELTLPQLRDLVVLKRNDVMDANYKLFISPSQGYLSLYKASDDVFYAYASKSKCWDKSRAVSVNTKDLEPISEEKDPALISGADVPALIKKGESVQFRSVFNVQGGGEWKDLDLERDEEELTLGDLINTRFEWRLKPQTIKLELELPKPFEPKEGDEYFYISTLQHCLYWHDVWGDEPADITQAAFGAYRTEEEIKQVVDQLRKIRGTNS
ncbi:hypothetical protein ACKERC_02720 [Acinetobacter baumannii]|uniref:hypothetical protein n=1 Tax=Acinetobacter baumannii TaxID=470 RepID=UPI0038B526A7